MKIRNIKVSEENWKKIMEIKLDLGYNTSNDVISKILALFYKTYKKKNTHFYENNTVIRRLK